VKSKGIRWLGLAAALVAACIAGYLVGTAPPKQVGDDGSRAALRKLRIGGAESYELNLPCLVAIASGFMRENGIDIAEYTVGAGSNIRNALIAKDLDFALLAFVHVPLARSKGEPVKIVLSTHEREIFSLIARKGLEGEVKNVADLKGKKMGVTKPGSGSWALGCAYVKKAGLEPEKDVEIVPMGENLESIRTALATGNIDAFPSWEPLTTKATADGTAYPLVSIWRPDEHKKWVGDRAMSMVLATREDVTQTQPELVLRMVSAMKLGLLYIRTHRPVEIADLLLGHPKTKGHFSGLTRDEAAAIIERIHDGFGTGSLSRSGYETEMALYVEAGLLKKAVPYSESCDLQFAGGSE